MRVLWLSNETPDVRGQGGQRRQYFQIRELMRVGISVEAITLAGPQDDQSLRELATVRRVRRYRRFGVPDPIGRAVIARAVRDNRFDAIVIAHVESWALIRKHIQRSEIAAPVLVDFHNVYSSWADRGGNPEMGRQFDATEREVVNHAAAVSLCSQAESDRLATRGSADRLILRNGVEPEEWPLVPRVAGSPAIGAFGNWDWIPNRSGISWLLESVWPDVLRRIPDARFLIAGAGLPPRFESVKGVEYVGRLNRLSELVEQVDVLVAPIRAGVGAAVKYAESLASGRGVVATEDAATAHPEAPALVSDDASSWVEHLSALLTDSGRAEELGERCRDYAISNLTWQATTAGLVSWIRTHSGSGEESE